MFQSVAQNRRLHRSPSDIDKSSDHTAHHLSEEMATPSTDDDQRTEFRNCQVCQTNARVSFLPVLIGEPHEVVQADQSDRRTTDRSDIDVIAYPPDIRLGECRPPARDLIDIAPFNCVMAGMESAIYASGCQDIHVMRQTIVQTADDAVWWRLTREIDVRDLCQSVDAGIGPSRPHHIADVAEGIARRLDQRPLHGSDPSLYLPPRIARTVVFESHSVSGHLFLTHRRYERDHGRIFTLHNDNPMSAQPLRLAILWHQHQPYYKVDNGYLLPWARLHATKDYYDMAALLDEYPRIRQTINVVPSLLDQLIDYSANNAGDAVLDLTLRHAAMLTPADQVTLLRSFFLCNVDRMILPYARYAELYRRVGNVRVDSTTAAAVASTFTEQDWRDLQVWYVLTWIGELTRSRGPFRQLFSKQKGFTEEEKIQAVEASRQIIAAVIPTWRRLMKSGQVELSVTPYYHPILPILCDSHVALEALPNATLPHESILFPEDAHHQVTSAIEAFRAQFDEEPVGMWPSEGAVSDQALAIMRSEGIAWSASDEGILRRTLGEEWTATDKYFPHLFKTRSGPLWMVFRDHDLSDAIGFVYATWNAEEAAADFYNRLVEIRNRIIQERGPDALADAVVPVILDGENCWEYYDRNGLPFLRSLYRLLSTSSEIETATIGAVTRNARPSPERTHGRIFAGSWIGSSFKIWIGGEEDNQAWDALAEARCCVLSRRDHLPPGIFDAAMKEIYIAQGSDWFWWYGDENQSANQDDFDDLFRMHLRTAYELVGERAPEKLKVPMRGGARLARVTPPRASISPVVDGKMTSAIEWSDAGWFVMERVGGAMHHSDAIERRFWYGADSTHLYVRFDTGGGLRQGQKICLTIAGHRTILLHYTPGRMGVEVIADETGFASLDNIAMTVGETLEGAVPLTLLVSGNAQLAEIGFVFEMFEGGHQTERFPTQGEVRCPLS